MKDIQLTNHFEIESILSALSSAFPTFIFKRRYDRCEVSINLRIIERKNKLHLEWNDPVSLFHSGEIHEV